MRKTKKKKRRIPHPASILQKEEGLCYLCGKLNHIFLPAEHLEMHHVFGGPNRLISEMNGFKVKLCPEHHRTGKEAVHRKMENMRMIQKDTQRAYEREHTRQQFVELIGRNYLEDDNEKP